MFPLRDENPTVRTPYVTIGLIVMCALAFLWQLAEGPNGEGMILYRYGFIPSFFFGHQEQMQHVEGVFPPMTIITSMFLHGGWMHLIGNMMFLWIFGNNIEDVLGHRRFIVFYLLSGICAALAQGLVDTTSTIPMIGASGAVSGVLGAYILLFPKARVLTVIFLGFFLTTMHIAAGWFLGIWFVMQWVNAMISPMDGGGVAFWAHIGGFVAGIVLLFLLKPRGRRVRPAFRQSGQPRQRGKGPWGRADREDRGDKPRKGPWG